MAKPYGRLYQKGKNVSIMGIDTYDVWPIGSVYISVNSINPSTYFGGTWVKIAQGRTLVGEGSIAANSDNWCGTVNAGSFVAYAGTTGGEVTHKLTTSEMPSHTHSFKRNGGYSNGIMVDTGALGAWGSPIYQVSTSNYTAVPNTPSIDTTGGNDNHNNLMPYLVVHIWKRIA